VKNYNYANKNTNNILKENIHNRLFNDSTKRQIFIWELEQKINQNEEEKCTFSPKINNNLIKYNSSFFQKINKNFLQEPFSNERNNNYSYFNNHKKKYIKCDCSINKTKSVKLLKNINSDQFFNLNNKNNKTINNISKNKTIIERNNNSRDFQILNCYNTNKDIIPINFNGNNIINKQSNYNLVLNSVKDNLINNGIINYNNIRLNKSHKSINKTEKNIMNNKSCNKINNIEIETINKENNYGKFNKFMELNKKREKKIRNKTFIKNNKFGFQNQFSFFKDNQTITNNITHSKEFKKAKSNAYLNEIDYKNKNKNNNNLNINKKSKITKYEDEKKKTYFLQKSYSIFKDYFNPLLINSNNNPENEVKKIKQEFKNNKNICLSKRNKSQSSININKNKSFTLTNKYLFKNSNIFDSYQNNFIKDKNKDSFNSFFNKKKNKNPLKIEYFYTFRNKKEPLNYFSNINSLTKTNKNIKEIKTKNDLNINIKESFRKKNTAISIIDKNNEAGKNKVYNLNNNKINNIYLNNYDAKYYIKNNYSNSKNIKNKLLSSNAYIYGKTSINTNNTNNETKGYSSSTLSVKDIRIIKTNSRRESKNNNSIQNNNEIVNENKNSIGANYISDYKNIKIIKKKQLKFNNNNLEKQDLDKLKINSEIINNYINNKENDEDNDNLKLDNSMTLQTISDSKMLDLAEHYIDTKDDCLDDIGIKKIIYKKPIKNE